MTKEEIAELPEKVRSIIVADLPEDMRGIKKCGKTLKFLPHFSIYLLLFCCIPNANTLHREPLWHRDFL